MPSFLVGGAVRDQLLGLEVKDRDWVVTGCTIDDMLEQGFTPVGSDFPVFLHPKTKEEYALARTERKTGTGYTGFDCISDPSVSIEDDLLRRDLTINAIAEAANGRLIDPFNGQQDIKDKKLRHVSSAFIEDPLRVLRVARFAARFHHLGFTIAAETQALMQQISKSSELKSLKAERILTETEKALSTKNPEVYFQVLRDVGALKTLFKEIDDLFGIPQTAAHHPEIDTGVHTLMVVQQARLLSDKPEVVFAALCHDLGKALSPKEHLPKHHGHEHSGIPLVKALSKRLSVPNDYRNLALISCEYHLHGHRAFELKPATIAKLFKQTDAYRRPERFIDFLSVCEADSKGRLGFEQHPYPQKDYLLACFTACKAISKKDVCDALEGPAIGQAIEQARAQVIGKIKKEYPQ
jgi:tRNA nucleotidyltransferase (CCA-adding enzyme)